MKFKKLEPSGSVTDQTVFPNELTNSILQLMCASSINRLFTRKDLKELIFRSMLVFPELNMEKNYFEKNFLYEVNCEEGNCRMGIDDLVGFIGIDLCESIVNFSRNYWLDKISGQRKHSIIMALFCNWPFGISKGFGINDEGEMMPSTECELRPIDCPDEDEIARAEKYSSFLVSQIDTQIFEELNKVHESYIAERIINYPEKTKDYVYPDFDFELIPDATKNVILERILESYLLTDEKEKEEYLYHFTKLIWAHANYFYSCTPDGYCVFDSHYDQDGTYDWLFELFGCHYEWSYDDMRLYELEDLLRGVFPNSHSK